MDPAAKLREMADNTLMDELESKLNKASLQGKRYAFWYATIPKEVRKRLSQKGYHIRKQEKELTKSKVCYKISW